MELDDRTAAREGVRGVFATTHWSLVVAAGNESGQAALETLCRTYWPCVYSYVRRFGKSEEEARDCTQDFFYRLVERKWTAQASRDRGRFRTFLICRLKNFLADEWDHARAIKRGGGKLLLSLDDAESICLVEDQRNISADQIYDRQWAFSMLKVSLDRLREEFNIEGKGRSFDLLKPFVGGGEEIPSYAEVALALQSTEAATKMAVSRMRQRFRELVRAEVAQTVSNGEDLDAEIRYIIDLLGN